MAQFENNRAQPAWLLVCTFQKESQRAFYDGYLLANTFTAVTGIRLLTVIVQLSTFFYSEASTNCHLLYLPYV